MNNDEIKDKQEETLNNLKKYNKVRKTEIVDDPEEIKIPSAGEILEYADRLRERGRYIEPTEGFKVKARIKEIRNPIPGLLDNEPASDLEDGKPFWATKPNVAFDLAKFDDDVYASEDDSEELEEPETLIVGDSVNPVMERPVIAICEFCGNFRYFGQLHGLGYCREKIQYES